MNIEKPKRVRRTYVLNLPAPPEKVFPLFCPVREQEWVEGWDPEIVITESGYVETDCLFVTRGNPSNSIWIVCQHDPQARRLEMYKVTPNHTVGKLQIEVTPHGTSECQARVCYEFTSLSSSGDEFLKDYTEERYQQLMARWHQALTACLQGAKNLK